METCKIFVNRNFGNGYAYAYPWLTFFQDFFLRHMIRDLDDGVSQRWGFWWVYHDCEPDTECTDLGAKDRSPVIDMTIVFPFLLKGSPEQLPGFESFLNRCRSVVRSVRHAGVCKELAVEVPEMWCEE